MQSAPPPSAPAPRRSPYVWFVLGTTAIILFVFAEPSLARLLGGEWQRGRFVYVNTASLDAHAVLGFVFVFAFLTQVAFGWAQARRRGIVRLHRLLGRALLGVVAPIFLLSALWVLLDRATNIAPEDSVVFKRDRPMLKVSLGALLVLCSGFLARATLAIRRGDVATHVDSILGAFLIAGSIALVRFLYALCWAVLGGSPLSLMGMYFVTVALVVLAMASAFALAGRLRANFVPLATVAGVAVALFIGGRDHFVFLDLP